MDLSGIITVLGIVCAVATVVYFAIMRGGAEPNEFEGLTKVINRRNLEKSNSKQIVGLEELFVRAGLVERCSCGRLPELEVWDGVFVLVCRCGTARRLGKTTACFGRTWQRAVDNWNREAKQAREVAV
jgi:hypothetical protein